MKQHITQEQATSISAKFAEDESYETNICNAAVQHYIGQQAKDFPVLPAPQWLGYIRGYTLSQLQAYGAACAAHVREVALEEAVDAIVDIASETTSQWPHRIINAIEALKKAGK